VALGYLTPPVNRRRPTLKPMTVTARTTIAAHRVEADVTRAVMLVIFVVARMIAIEEEIEASEIEYNVLCKHMNLVGHWIGSWDLLQSIEYGPDEGTPRSP